jgi:Leucine-rich repeat (LRR) protein
MVNLNESNLEGTIPPSLGKVTTLTHLYLASNSFEGPVPAEVASLPNLRVVDFSFNKLDGVIPVFASSDMQTIDLGHNQFAGNLVSNAVDGMSSLEVFDIKYNLVTGTIPSLTGPLPSLIELDLSNNQFLGKSLLFDNAVPSSASQLTLTFVVCKRNHPWIRRSARGPSETLPKQQQIEWNHSCRVNK